MELPPELTVFYALALALGFGKLFEEIITRTRYPPVLGDLIAGLIIGSSVLGIYIVDDTVKALAWFGVTILLFYAGLTTRYSEFVRLLPIAGIITIGEALAAFSMGFIIGYVLGYGILGSFFLGAILEATSVSLTIRTLIELGKLDTIEGHTIMEIAVLDDLASLITISIGASIVAMAAFTAVDVVLAIVKCVAVWSLLVFILHRISRYIIGIVSKMHIEEAMISFLIALFAASAVLVGLTGVSPLVGAYAAGLALSEAIGLREVRDSIRKLAIVFSTIFFVTTAAQLDIRAALRLEYLTLYILMVAAAFAGKMLGAGLTTFIMGFPIRSVLRIAVGLFPRCEFAIIAAYTAMSFKVLGPEAYFAALIIVIVTNLATPPLLKIVFAGREYEEVRIRLRKIVLRKTPVHAHA